MAAMAQDPNEQLKSCIDRVNAEGVVQLGSDAVIMSSSEYSQIKDMAYLFQSSANARRLLDAYEEALAGAFREREVDLES